MTTFDSAQPTGAQRQAVSMTASQVADRLGVSRSRVHQLDGELRPERCACGARQYDPAAVAAYMVQRAAERAALSRARSARMRELRERQ